MFQLIKKDNVFERKDEELKDEVTYYAGLPGQFKNEEATYEEAIPTDLEGQETDQNSSKESSDAFIGPAAAGDFVRLQRDFYEKYGEYKALSQHAWEAMHTAFSIASTSAIVSQLPTGEDGEVLKPSIMR